MPIPCLPTETSFDVRCPVCDRGFLLLSEPTLLLQRGSLRREARRALAAQHEGRDGRGSVHPDEVFDLPGIDGDPDTASSAWAVAAALFAGARN